MEETMETFIPLLPEMQYFRFNPGDYFSLIIFASSVEVPNVR